MKLKNIKILFVQRVITGYRLDLLKTLCEDFEEVGVITSKGDAKGTLKVAKFKETLQAHLNLNIHQLPSLKIGYSGESRSTKVFFYPSAISVIKKYDVIVFEGTTNLVNNIYLVPLAKLFGKKTIWWDAGYSLPTRTFKRKIIDAVVKPFVKCTDAQMAYSSLANNYMKQHMGATNSFLNLNTINTSFFESISNEIKESVEEYEFDKKKIKLLYVGVIESRKKVKELIDIILELNSESSEKHFTLNIVGGGDQLEELKDFVRSNKDIKLHGPIYDKNKLKAFYFNSDLFVLPGDGGLAILQSLLFGLPVLSIKGADGTELDYIKEEFLLVEEISEIKMVLNNLSIINRKAIINNLPNVKHENWKMKLENQVKSI